MPNITAQTRWRVHKASFSPWWHVHALEPDNVTRMPGTVKVFRRWSGAMGYANLKIAQANGRLPHE
jgi:hypothetical protein